MVNKFVNIVISKINCFIVVCIMFIFLRVGIIIFKEIVEMMIIIKRILLINFNYLNVKVKIIEIIIINVNIVSVSLRCLGIFFLCLFFFCFGCEFFLNVLKLIFRLFKNIKKINLSVDKILRNVFFFIKLRKEWFIIIFINILVIIIGRKFILKWCIMIGVINVVMMIIIKDKNFIWFFYVRYDMNDVVNLK